MQVTVMLALTKVFSPWPVPSGSPFALRVFESCQPVRTISLRLHEPTGKSTYVTIPPPFAFTEITASAPDSTDIAVAAAQAKRFLRLTRLVAGHDQAVDWRGVRQVRTPG